LQRDDYHDVSHIDKESNIVESQEHVGHEKNKRVMFLDEEERFESRDTRDRKRERDHIFNNLSVKIQRSDDNDFDSQNYSGTRIDQIERDHDSPNLEKKKSNSNPRQKEQRCHNCHHHHKESHHCQNT
jgi:hypothetical protein